MGRAGLEAFVKRRVWGLGPETPRLVLSPAVDMLVRDGV